MPKSYYNQMTNGPVNAHLTLEIYNEPPHGKTNNLHRRKQRRKSASR